MATSATVQDINDIKESAAKYVLTNIAKEVKAELPSSVINEARQVKPPRGSSADFAQSYSRLNEPSTAEYTSGVTMGGSADRLQAQTQQSLRETTGLPQEVITVLALRAKSAATGLNGQLASVRPATDPKADAPKKMESNKASDLQEPVGETEKVAERDPLKLAHSEALPISIIDSKNNGSLLMVSPADETSLSEGSNRSGDIRALQATGLTNSEKRGLDVSPEGLLIAPENRHSATRVGTNRTTHLGMHAPPPIPSTNNIIEVRKEGHIGLVDGQVLAPMGSQKPASSPVTLTIAPNKVRIDNSISAGLQNQLQGSRDNVIQGPGSVSIEVSMPQSREPVGISKNGIAEAQTIPTQQERGIESSSQLVAANPIATTDGDSTQGIVSSPANAIQRFNSSRGGINIASYNIPSRQPIANKRPESVLAIPSGVLTSKIAEPNDFGISTQPQLISQSSTSLGIQTEEALYSFTDYRDKQA
jgi:hypothetical protein